MKHSTPSESRFMSLGRGFMAVRQRCGHGESLHKIVHLPPKNQESTSKGAKRPSRKASRTQKAHWLIAEENGVGHAIREEAATFGIRILANVKLAAAASRHPVDLKRREAEY